MHRAPWALIFLLFSGTVLADATTEFRALLDEAWQFELDQDPTYASYLGDRRANDAWQDQSLASFDARQAALRAVMPVRLA